MSNHEAKVERFEGEQNSNPEKDYKNSRFLIEIGCFSGCGDRI